MKFKKSFLIICLIICLFSITSVCASDVNETDITSITVNDITEIEVIGANNNPVNNNLNQASNINSEILENGPTGTFNELNKYIKNSGSELNLTKNYFFTDKIDTTYTFGDGISIDKTITINGNGHIISGNNIVRAFSISGNNVILNNIVFVNCLSSKDPSLYGGTIKWNGSNGLLNNCSFINSAISSSSIYGGMVYWEGSNGTLSNCKFINLSTEYNHLYNIYGGFIYWNGNSGNLNSCNFTNLTTFGRYSYGGNIYWNGTDGKISKSNFKNISTEGLDSEKAYSTKGGTIYWSGSNGSLDDSVFVSCVIPSTYSYSYGGSIYWEGEQGNLTKCNFTNQVSNTYFFYGGSIYWMGNQGFLKDCNFNDCRILSEVSAWGGAIYIKGSQCSLFNCNFDGCAASANGGAIYWEGELGNLSECEFSVCTLERNDPPSTDGGAAIFFKKDAILNNCEFISCHCYANGGGVYCDNRDSCEFINCSFSNCYSEFNGGAVFSHYSSAIFINCSFLSSSSKFYVVKGSLINCNISNCILNSGSSGVVLGSATNCNFDNCNGGALSGANATNCNFRYCSSTSKGGAVVASNVKNCTFFKCTSSNYAGAIYLSGSGVVSNCTFTECYSTGEKPYGNIIYCDADNCTLNNCNFTDCSSSSKNIYGGAIYWNGKNAIINKCNFDNCTFTPQGVSQGCLIYLISENCIISNSTFKGSSLPSPHMGVIFLKMTTGKIYNCYFENYNLTASTSYSAGAIYCDGSEFGIENCTFVNCSSKISGGAIYWKGGSIYNCTFVNCSSKTSGGAIYWNGEKGFIYNCTFVNCSSKTSGGAIYWNGYGEISNCDFINCSAKSYGGAIFSVTTGKQSIVNSNFNLNIVNRLGNDIYWNNKYEISYLNCTFNNKKEATKNNIHLVNKYDSKISVHTNNIIIGQDEIIIVSMDPNATGLLNISLENINGSKTYHNEFNFSANSYITLKLSNLPYGTYNLFVNYDGGDFYKECTLGNIKYSSSSDNNIIFNVLGLNNTLNVKSNDVEAGDSLILNITFDNNCSGKLKVNILNRVYSYTVVNSKVNAIIPNVIGGNYSYTINYLGDDNYEPIFVTKTIKVPYKTTELILDVQNVTYGQYFTITPKINATGKLSIFIDGVFKNNITVGNEFKINTLNVGEHELKVIYNGNNYYSPVHSTEKFHVSKAENRINISVDNVEFKHAVVITVTFIRGLTGEIILEVNNKNYTRNITNSNLARFYITNLNVGEYTIKARYIGDVNHNGTYSEAVFNVTKIKNINIDVPSEINNIYTPFSVVFLNEVTGNVTVTLNGKNYTFKIPEDDIKISIFDLKDGNYNYTISYSGDDNYHSFIKYGSFKLNTTIDESTREASSINIYHYGGSIRAGETKTFSFGTTYSATGTISLYLNDNLLDTILVGEQFNITGLAAGNYTFKAKYNGDNKYNSSENSIELNVIKTSPKITINVNETKFGNPAKVQLVMETTYFKINGFVEVSNYYFGKKQVRIVDGIGYVDIPNLPIGEQDVYVEYFGDENNKYANKFVLFNVVKGDASSNIVIPTNINPSENTVINLPKGASGTITLRINNQNYYFNVNNGVVNIVMPNTLNKGNYDYTISYSGDSNYSPFSKSGTLIVDKNLSKIVASSVTTVYNNGGNLIITLQDINKKPINGATLSVNLNGVNYFTTDSKGQIKVSTNSLAPTTYSATITFGGNNNYIKSTATVKVTVKKATPKLTAKAKAFKKSVKTKKYSITLKTNQNKVMKNTKVTIKVNKKTYTAKTNKKGVATFKITKLTKKGTFKATITYKGSAYYNKVTKNINIKCK